MRGGWRALLGAPGGEPPVRHAIGAPVLEAAAVTVTHGGRHVVRDVDLELRAGEVLALVGPNGAGKSSLLRALAGEHPAGGGAVAVGGRPLDRWAAADLARVRAVLPQDVRVAFPFPAADVVRMGRAPWAGTAAADDDDAAVAEALALTDTAHLARRPVTVLSGGERARVALARVLAQRTQVLLLDEPTAALDLHHAEGALAAVRARVDGGDAAVVVLHDLGAAAAHADRVALLDDGRLVACGPVADVLTADRLSATYRHPVRVVPDPVGGPPLVVPDRAVAARRPAAGPTPTPAVPPTVTAATGGHR